MQQKTQKILMNLPPELLQQVLSRYKLKTKTQAVILGLQELVKKFNRQTLISLKGSGFIKLSPAQLKKMRSR